jgi:hypothetical protein
MRALNMNYKTRYDFVAGRHLIVSVKGFKPGPTLIALGSVHGNEPAEALAARRVQRAELCRPLIVFEDTGEQNF